MTGSFRACFHVLATHYRFSLSCRANLWCCSSKEVTLTQFFSCIVKPGDILHQGFRRIVGHLDLVQDPKHVAHGHLDGSRVARLSRVALQQTHFGEQRTLDGRVCIANMSGSGRIQRLSCIFWMTTHDVCHAYSSITDFVNASWYPYRMRNSLSASRKLDPFCSSCNTDFM